MVPKKKVNPSLPEIRARVASRQDISSDATKQLIREAARDLMSHNQVVNVKTIAEKAEISRGTFYAHYEGLDSLTVEMMVEDLSNEPFSVQMLVEKYAERRAMYRKILQASNSRAVLEAMVEATCDALLISSGKSSPEHKGRFERLARFTAWGYIGTMDGWLRQTVPFSVVDLADFLRDQTPTSLLPANESK
jgi:AcrR family transcriptional regulator